MNHLFLRRSTSLNYIRHSDDKNQEVTLLWRQNGRGSVSNHQPHDCSLNRLFRRRSKKTSTLRITGLCAGNSPGTVEFTTQMASNAENLSIWWCQHEHSYSFDRMLNDSCNFNVLNTGFFLWSLSSGWNTSTDRGKKYHTRYDLGQTYILNPPR